MNLLLLEQTDFETEHVANVSDRRAKHLVEVLGVSIGSRIRCGKVNGKLGEAIVEKIVAEENAYALRLHTELSIPPPEASSIELLCALPRPKMLRRIVRTCAELGVKNISFLNSYRVEKSYWQSPQLGHEALRSFCLEGLEQAGDTVLPKIQLFKRFKPFVEDELAQHLEHKAALLAHPSATRGVNQVRPLAAQKCVLAIGPEGGFIGYEIERLTEAGFTSFSLGPRILRCDTVVPYLLAALTAN